MVLANTSDRVGMGVFNGLGPEKGPVIMPIPLDFSAQNPFLVDLEREVSADRIEWVQTIFIDNSANTTAVTITWAISGQIIVIPPGSQAYLPVLVPNTPRFSISTTGTPTVYLHAINVPMPAIIWNTSGTVLGTITVRTAGGAGTDYSANKPTALVSTLATVPANTTRNEVCVQNQGGNQMQVQLDHGGGSFTYILLQGVAGNSAGDFWSSTTFKGQLKVLATLAGDQVAVYEN